LLDISFFVHNNMIFRKGSNNFRILQRNLKNN